MMIDRIKLSFGQNTPFAVFKQPQPYQQTAVEPDKFQSSKKKNIIKYSAIAAGVVLAVIAFVKRKAIGEFFSKLFNRKGESPSGPIPPERPNVGGSGSTSPPSGGIKIEPEIPPIQYSQQDILSIITSSPKEDMAKLVKDISKGTREEQYNLLDMYNKLDSQHTKMLDSDSARLVLGQKLYQIEKQMKEGNISFVPKPPNNFTNDEEKWNYLHRAMTAMDNNEASAMDALNMFKKYGSRLYNVEKGENSLLDLSVGVSGIAEKLSGTPAADKVLNRYVDVFSEKAIKEETSNDASHLNWLFGKYKKEMSKDTLIKFIDALKPISCDKQPLISFTVTIKNHPDLLPKLNQNDLAEVRKHLSELEEAVKDLPVNRLDISTPK